MAEISESMKAFVGSEADYTHPKTGKVIRGMCEGVRRSASVIVDVTTGEEWPGVQFRLKPLDGSRAFWTTTYPDKDAGVTRTRTIREAANG